MVRYKKEMVLKAKPPFDLTKSFRNAYQYHGPNYGIVSDDDHLVRAGIYNELVYLIEIRKGIKETDVLCTISSDSVIDEKMMAGVGKDVSNYLSLDEDVERLYQLAKGDKVFEHIVKDLYGYHQVRFFTPFESVCWAILTQHFPAAQAAKVMGNIASELGGSIVQGENTFLAFPLPDTLLRSFDRLDPLIKNRKKLEYLHGALKEFSTIDYDFLYHGDYDEVLSWLRNIKGIGKWSASLILIRGLGRLERASVAESPVKDAAMELYDVKSMDELDRVSARYEDLQGLWEHYLVYWLMTDWENDRK